MPFTQITPLPAAPSRFAAPADFETQVDEYLVGQAVMVSEINTLVSELNTLDLSSNVYTLSTTQANSTTTLADITGLTQDLVANKIYRVTAYITFQSLATTTGIELGFSAPSGSRPMLTITVPIVSTDTSSALSKNFPVDNSTITGTVKGTGVTQVNSNHTATVTGIILAGDTGGTFKLRFASEVAGSAITLQIGSTLLIETLL